jgi:hypothetical protein
MFALALVFAFNVPHALCIPADSLQWQLTWVGDQADISLAFNMAEVLGGDIRPGYCPGHPITVNEALRVLLAGTPYTWEWSRYDPTGFVMVFPVPPCNPQAGALWTPVPPCLPPSLEVHR